MKNIINIILLTFCLCTTLPVGAQILDKKVTLNISQMTVEQALKLISKKYGVKFSYSNSLLPYRPVSLNVTELPLHNALDKLLDGSGLTYQLIGDHVVIKKSAIKQKSTISGSTKEEKPVVPPVNMSASNYPVKPDTIIERIPGEEYAFIPQPILIDENPVNQFELKELYREQKRGLKRFYQKYVDSVKTKKEKESFKEHWKMNMQNLKREYFTLKDTMRYKMIPFIKGAFTKDSLDITPRYTMDLPNSRYQDTASLDSNTPVDTTIQQIKNKEDDLLYDHIQVTFIPPMSTHGTMAPRYVSDFSFNIIGGVSAATEVMEFGGVANVDRFHASGVQFGGVTNIVGGDVKGVQFGGVSNVVGKSVYGMQFGGVTNVAGDDVWGGQFAGVVNIAGDTVNGIQAAGLINIAPTAMYGIQTSGLINVSNGTMRGTQIGFINTAKKMKGAQLGFLNFSDSLTGTAIGFLSFSRRGYHHIELYSNEIMYANAAFKTGVRHFYNIIQVGYRWEGDRYYWSFGYGIGSEIGLSKRLALNMDAICTHVNENEAFTDELNLFNQFRLNLGYGLTKNIYVFAGPTYNVSVSNYKKDNGSLGSPLVPKSTLYNEDSAADWPGNRVNVAMWIGVNGGIRF